MHSSFPSRGPCLTISPNVELNFLSTFLENSVSPLIAKDTKLTEDQKKAIIQPLANIINGPQNVRIIDKDLEDSVVRPIPSSL